MRVPVGLSAGGHGDHVHVRRVGGVPLRAARDSAVAGYVFVQLAREIGVNVQSKL